MKTNDNANRLKTYKIKNHDSGKTYTVKAVSYTDAKMKYNKYILKDAIMNDTSRKELESKAMQLDLAVLIKEFEAQSRTEGSGHYNRAMETLLGMSKDKQKQFIVSELWDSRLKRLTKDAITEDADIAQTDIKSTYLPEDANADNIRYLGFNEKRKLSFYGYGDRYFVHYDLEGRTEEIDKETVQKILKKNILGEIDENDLINKEPQSEEIVSDAFTEDAISAKDFAEYGWQIEKKLSVQIFWEGIHGDKTFDQALTQHNLICAEISREINKRLDNSKKQFAGMKADYNEALKKKQERGDR